MEPKHWEVMQRMDPQLYQKVRAWRRHLFDEGVVPRKYKELMMVAMFSAAKFPAGLRDHVELATEHGATEQELFETVSLSLIVGGVSAYRQSILVLDEVMERSLRTEDS